MLCHGVVTSNQRSKSSTDVPATGDGRRASGQASQVEHPTMAERTARGKAERKLAPLSVHGEWQPSSDRPSPVGLLEEQAASRVQELVPIRYGRMLVSPFTFYRGAAYLMASDLAARLEPACRCNCAVMRICPTSASSPPPTGSWSSASMTSTRRCLDRSSGTSKGWWPASPSPDAIAASTPSSARRSTRHCPVLSRGDAGPGADEEARRLVFPPGHRGDRRSAEVAAEDQEARRSGSRRMWPKPGPRTA